MSLPVQGAAINRVRRRRGPTGTTAAVTARIAAPHAGRLTSRVRYPRDRHYCAEYAGWYKPQVALERQV